MNETNTKSNLLISVAFPTDDVISNIDTEYLIKNQAAKILAGLVNDKKISHFAIADDEIISDKVLDKLKDTTVRLDDEVTEEQLIKEGNEVGDYYNDLRERMQSGLKYKIGDNLLIRSKIMSYDEYIEHSDNIDWIPVCTSCSNGWDRFYKSECDIQNGYVIHEVVVTGYDNYVSGKQTYHVKNVNTKLSTSGTFAWQGCDDLDVVKLVKRG